jgi:hypothetical protein
VVAYPEVGTEAQTTTLITENFDLKLRFGTGVAASLKTYNTDPETGAAWGLKIVKGSGVTVSTKVGSDAAVSHILGTEAYISIPSSTAPVVSISV